MFIDWFTVGAQTLNFLILVWLMKRFLYKPILDAIDSREKRIAAELSDADAKRDAAQKQREEFLKKNRAFDEQRADLLSKAKEDASTERAKLLDEARAAANGLRANRQEALRDEQQSLNDEFRRRTREEVFAIARKTLTDLAGVSLESQMSEVFTRRVRQLHGKAKNTFAEALTSSSQPVLVRSAFDLPAEQQAAIKVALNEVCAADIRLRFATAPAVISGIEVSANGHKIGWSVADYLMTLEKSVEELLQMPTQGQARPVVKSDSISHE